MSASTGDKTPLVGLIGALTLLFSGFYWCVAGPYIGGALGVLLLAVLVVMLL